MHKRSDIDRVMVEKDVLDLEKIESWLDRLFLGKKSSGFVFPGEVYEWWKTEVVANYRVAKSEYVRKMMRQKMLHTWEVVEAGFDIARSSPEVDWDWYFVGSVCLLHDVARFKQAQLESFSDEKTEFDHALVGSEMIENKKFDDAWLEQVKPIMAQAVRWHNKISCGVDEPYALFVRDADKLGLLRYMPYLIDLRVYKGEGVTKQALNDYLDKKMVKHIDMNTKADVCLAWAAWEIDLNYVGTREAFEREGIKKWIFGELKMLGVDIL